jgi:hypothetical protein
LAAQAITPKASPRPGDFKVPKVWGLQKWLKIQFN